MRNDCTGCCWPAAAAAGADAAAGAIAGEKEPSSPWPLRRRGPPATDAILEEAAAGEGDVAAGVGEELPEDDYARLFGLCQNREAAFNGQGQRPGSVVFEQWVAVVCETAAESKGESEKSFFGLF